MARRRSRRGRPIISKARVEEFRQAFTGWEIDSLVSVYRRAAAEALNILSDGYAALGSRQRAKALLRQYHEVLTELRDESAAWISSNLPAAYHSGIEFGDEGIKGVQRAGINLGKPQKAVFAQVHREAVQAIVNEVQRTMDFAFAQIGRRVNDAFRKVGVQEVARGIAEGKTRLQVSREIKGRLLAEGKLKFTDRSGRDWDLDRYAEMVARTTTRQAMTIGTLNRLREDNIELAQVSAHNAADFCIYYENVIVYIGPEPNPTSYPPLSAINGGPPFHPNCAHVMTPFVISLATPEERAAGIIEPELLNKTPAQLQRRFRKDFPERAQEEGKRIRAAEKHRIEKRARRVQAVPAGSLTVPPDSALGGITKDDYHQATEVVWVPDKMPSGSPDYVSPGHRGSRYWLTEDGVIRASDHWGWGVASCDWHFGTLEQRDRLIAYRLEDEAIDRKVKQLVADRKQAASKLIPQAKEQLGELMAQHPVLGDAERGAISYNQARKEVGVEVWQRFRGLKAQARGEVEIDTRKLRDELRLTRKETHPFAGSAGLEFEMRVGFAPYKAFVRKTRI